MRRLACMAILLLAPGALRAAPAPDTQSTTGLWKIDGDVMGRPVNMMCQLTETNRKLDGTCSGAADGFVAHKVAGTVKGQKLQLYFQTSIGSGSITLIVSGTLSDDRSKMNGDLDVEPMAVSGTFTAAREPAIAADAGAITATDLPADTKAAATAAPPAIKPANSSGTWNIDGDVQGTSVKLTCVLAEADQKLTGTCTGEDKAARTLTGQVTDKGLGWHFDAEYEGQPITVSMSATLAADGAKMSGTVTVAPFDADGTFTGLKAVANPQP